MRKSRGSAFDLAFDSSEAAASTAMTLWHRLPMFASFASSVEQRAEGTRMLEEKSTAFLDGCLAANTEVFRLFVAAAMGQFAPLCSAPFTIASAGLTPAFRTVNANAKRLNKAVRR
jgi:hypothetical protein